MVDRSADPDGEALSGQLAERILEKLSIDIVGRSVGAGDAYFSLLTAIVSLNAPVYVLGMRLIAAENSLDLWHLSPIVLMLIALAVSFGARFPRKVLYDLNNPEQIYQVYLGLNRRLHSASIVATLFGGAGLLLSLYFLTGA